MGGELERACREPVAQPFQATPDAAIDESVTKAFGPGPPDLGKRALGVGSVDVPGECVREFGSVPPCWPDSRDCWPAVMPGVGVCNGGGLTHYRHGGAVRRLQTVLSSRGARDGICFSRTFRENYAHT